MPRPRSRFAVTSIGEATLDRRHRRSTRTLCSPQASSWTTSPSPVKPMEVEVELNMKAFSTWWT
jgi:hypothetical protein